MVEWTQVTDFLNQYGVIIFLLLVVGVFSLVKRIRHKKKIKEQAKRAIKLREQEEKENNQNIKAPIPPAGHADWAARFDNRPINQRQETDVMTKINDVGTDVDKKSEELEASLRNDFEAKRYELEEVVKKKEMIKMQGLKLANLYDKYQEREMHLVNIMQSIEYMMDRGGAQPPDGRA